MFIRLLLSVSLLATLAGCNAYDCQKICDRYQTCFDSKYNVGACAARCRNDSANDADYDHKANVCSACIDDQSCSSATFSCGGSCGSIVP